MLLFSWFLSFSSDFAVIFLCFFGFREGLKKLARITLLGVCMWNTMWKTCEKCPIFTLFSHIFHTFFTHFSHAFHAHISRACEILHSEIYVKRVWSDVIPFTHIFTYTSHGVSHGLSHVNPHLNSHLFSYTSHGVSHGLHMYLILNEWHNI